MVIREFGALARKAGTTGQDTVQHHQRWTVSDNFIF
jgi:hypothetical protein